jgi:hypothetical protein
MCTAFDKKREKCKLSFFIEERREMQMLIVRAETAVLQRCANKRKTHQHQQNNCASFLLNALFPAHSNNRRRFAKPLRFLRSAVEDEIL